MDDIQLTAGEQQILRRMVGPRYSTGNSEIRLTSNRFPNRMENKKYLIFLLEALVREAKTLEALRPQFEGKAE
jgi:hypothetical protein